MARIGWVFQGRGKLCWSYKKTTIVICCFNVVAALYILRSLYTSFCIYSNNVSHDSARYTEYQIRKMEESIRVRKAAEPIELIQVVKEIEKELAREDSVEELSKSVKQNIADEILERLKALSQNATEQREEEFDVQRSRRRLRRETEWIKHQKLYFQCAEALQTWRNKKLEEVKQLQLGNKTLDSTTSANDTELLRRALEFAWNLLLEDIGVWLPTEVIHKEHDDKPEVEEELEDQIIPGPPLPSECHTEMRTDYGGAAVRWGLTHHKETAADCCQACLDQAKNAKESDIKCNIWVYCPLEDGCHSPDIYEHKHQECWLKQAVTPKVTFKSRYSDSYRNSHPSAPQFVPWVSGVLSAA